MQLQSGHDRAFDVFLSYHWRDQAAVDALAHGLIDLGLHVFVDRWYLRPGRAWPQELEAVMGACQAVAVCLGAGEMGPWQQREVNMALERQAREAAFPVIPVLLPGADPVLGFLGQNTWVDLRARVDDSVSISILAGAISGKAPGPDTREANQLTAGTICPYRGLLYFREEDAPFFFGREAAVEQLAATVGRHSFVAVVGASGSGKSSVVRAGLLPRLRHNPGRLWEIATVVPGDRPMNALSAALLPFLEPDMTEADRLIETNKLARAMQSGELNLRDVGERVLAKQSGTDRLLVFVDQWEELYTLTLAEILRRRFIDLLLEVSARGPVSVVLSLRGDFVGRALSYRPLSDHLQDAQVNIGPMSRTELAAAIQIPAEKVGITFEHGLVERILDDAGQEPGNLPLLEFVLKQLWDNRRSGELLHSAYGEMGCLQGAIATRANEIYDKLTAAEEQAVQRIFLQLATPGEQGEYTRRRASLADVGPSSVHVLERLTDARLLVTSPSPGTDAGTIELSHEALIRNWDRYKTWLDQDREFLLWRKRLAGFVDVWIRNARQETGLLAGAFLTEAEKWLNERSDRLSSEEREYVSVSVACRRREQNRTGRRRQAVGALIAAFGLLALLFGIYSQHERRHAEEEANHSLALQLLAQSGQIAGTNLVNAILLGAAALSRQATYETKYNLFRLLNSMPSGLSGFLWGHSAEVLAVAFSPDGKMLATGGNDGTVIFWNAARRKPLGATLQVHPGAVMAVAFSPDGKILATSTADKSVILWDVPSRRRLGEPLLGHKDVVSRIVFAPDGKTLATVDVGRNAILWDVGSHKLLTDLLDGYLEEVWSIVFTPDGNARALGHRGTSVVLWDLINRKLVGQPLTTGYVGKPWLAAFTTDGKRMATAKDQFVSLWDANTGKQLGEPLAGGADEVSSLAFSPDGAVLASGDNDHAVALWDVASREPLMQGLKGHTGQVATLAFSPDGTILASGSSDRTAILWDVASIKLSRELRHRDGQVNCVAFSADGTMLATAEDEMVSLWDLGTRKQLGDRFRAPSRPVSLVFDRKGGNLAGIGMDGKVIVWNIADGRPLGEPLQTYARGVHRAAFSLDGKTLAAASFDGPVALWDLASRQPLGEPLKHHGSAVRAVAFSPDGKILATGAEDRTVILWDVASRRPIGDALTGHTAAVWSAAFSSDGKILATGSSHGDVILWDATSRRPLGNPLKAHDNAAIMDIAFHPKVKVLATASSDRTAILWDVVSRQALSEPLTGHSAEVSSIAFSPDGKTLATGSWDRSVILWNVETDPESLMARACQVANRNLTESEWHHYLGERPYREVCQAWLGDPY
jgi:WD40 repeat protein